MSRHLLIFGLGYTARRLSRRLAAEGWRIVATRRTPDAEALGFADEAGVARAIAAATHILSSVPPAGGEDPVLACYGGLIGGRWLGYLSSTGVYGDAAGAWVDEGSPADAGRNAARNAADAAWLAAGARVFRLPGIYGPGQSALDRITQGRAHRVDLPGQVFSRIHVDDIVEAVRRALGTAPPGAYNIADDHPVSQNAVVEEGCRLLGLPMPPLLALEDAGLSPMARGFYAENRRVANGKAKRVLGWRPRYPDFRAGLAALARSAITSPTSAAMPPAAASHDQR